MLEDVFPPPEELLAMEPEEIAVFLLDYLCDTEEQKRGHLNRYNFTFESKYTSYVSDRPKRLEVMKVVMEAWMWLEKEGMIAPKPGEQGDWVFITRKGFRLRDGAVFETYKKGHFLPKDSLDENLLRKVWPLFIRGDYDIAVFQAMKEVEVRVRTAASLPSSLIGVDLMRKAFHPDKGHLTDKSALPAEKEAMSALFAGCIGLFKNPSSHRDVKFDDPGEVAEIILTANYLLRLVERLSGSLDE